MDMSNKKMAMMGGDEVVANVGFSDKGLGDSEPEYPYCLKLYLGPDELQKLGVKELPAIDSEVSIVAKAEVVAIRMEKGMSSVELQITDMELGQPKKEKNHEQTLYGVESED